MHPNLPTHPFWDFSERIYQNAVVKDALLSLQNRLGLNANMILFCCWYGLSGRGRLRVKEVRDLLQAINIWHERIIEPLRKMRNQLKVHTNYRDVRQSILNTELEAEHVEQLMLTSAQHFEVPTSSGADKRLADICHNIAHYCRQTDIILAQQDCDDLISLISHSLPEIDMAKIRQRALSFLNNHAHLATHSHNQLALDINPVN